MSAKILIAILLVGLSVQQCTIGCLRCNNLNQCLLCDITNNYFLTGNTCQLTTQTNCAILTMNGNCVQCAANFYLDVNSQRCLAVSSTNVVSNCAQYNSGQVCTQCTGNFFVSAGRCAAVNTTVSNCASYSANGACSNCANGYISNNDFSGCVAVPSNNTCLYYTYVGCRACATGFVNNPNFYFTSFSSMPSVYSLNLVPIISPSNSWMPLSVCQATTILNCRVFSAFNFCTQCNAGFFLQNGNCIAFPLPVIFGCLTYSSLTTCSVCQAGMYLNQNLCLTNTVIANCLTYSGSSSTTTCVACTGSFYLQGNVCVNRTVSANIANCQTVALTADLCGTCSNNFILTTDGRACLPLIANCATYSASTFQTTVLQCSQCNNGFYLTSSGSTTVCVAGTISFCATYVVNSNTCTACQNGYYLANNVCTAHVTIANCATYDPTRANFCATCSSGFYNFAYTTVCVQTTVRSGCTTYSFDGNSCVACQAGFWLSSGNCNAIPSTFANCATYSGTQCTLCNTGYMINTLPTFGTCTLPLDYMNSTSNSPCAVMVSTPANSVPTWISPSSLSTNQNILTCGTCNNYMYGYQPLPAEAICVLTTQLTMYASYSSSVTNCYRWGMDYASNQQIVCMQCNSGFFITGYHSLAELSTATSCTSTCALTSNAIITDDLLGFVWICAPYGATGTAFIAATPCTRYARTYLRKIGAATLQTQDYQCMQVNQGSASAPSALLAYSSLNAITAATGYYFEQAVAGTPFTAANHLVGYGYSNTVDSASIFPNVFNYQGLLLNLADVTGAANVLLTQVTSFTFVQSNNLINCDIAWESDGTNCGSTCLAGGNYVQSTGTKHSCMRCAFGFQASFTGGLAAAAQSPYPSCVQMSNCASSSTVYGGLHPFLNSILSCHVCGQSNGASTFPTIWIETDTLQGTFVGYQVASKITLTNALTVIAANSGFKCYAAPTQVLLTTAPTYTTIANCAVYGNVLPFVIGGAAGTAYDVCLACAANYFPTYLGTQAAKVSATYPTWIVTACTASTNCDSSWITSFNSCGRCRSDQENNINPVYYAFHDLTLTNCYQAASKNCLVLLSSSFSSTGTSNTCDVCKAGYFKNTDNICEVYRVPNQSVNSGVFVNAYAASQAYTLTTANAAAMAANAADFRIVRLHYILSYKLSQYGINSCSTGYTLTPANLWAPRLCVWSSYVYNNTGSYPSSSNFINNCIRYNLTQVNSKNVCGGCNTGFIPTVDGSSCVSSASIPNCIYAQNGANNGLCYQCAVNFMNVNGMCITTTIPNCATYVNNQWSFTTPGVLQCATCVNGFFLSSDNLSCSPGLVSNCIQYIQGQSSQCSACATGFVLMTLNTVWYCYPVPASLNCALLQDTSSTSGANFGTISCATCSANSVTVYGARNWAALGLATQAQTLCMPFTPISNCLNYSQSNPIIKANTFSCTQCNSGFWFSATNNTCVARINMPAQCTNYSLTSDACTLCASGSFLSTDGRNCVAFPNGIFQCAIYSAATTCTQCNAGYYLSSNTCIVSTIINNCIIYSANFTCSACAAGFFLNNATSCVTATAANCLTYSSISVCASCATGFGLQTNNGVTSCVAVNLPNCVNATTVAPFTCLVCSTGYFPNSNGACALVSQTIANCLVYDSSTTCLTCSSNSILNVARTVCNSTFYSQWVDPNCQQNFLVNQPICYECQYGSYFVNGTCTSCANNTYASGCLTCDPSNNNICMVCRPGFYMNAQGGCVANNPTPTPTPTPTPNNGTNASETITKAIGLVFTLATVFFDRL